MPTARNTRRWSSGSRRGSRRCRSMAGPRARRDERGDGGPADGGPPCPRPRPRAIGAQRDCGKPEAARRGRRDGMILYPAIDLKGGACVRLLRGEMAAATVFSEDPAGQARAFVAAGCRWLHLVDLDGAFAGAPRNAEAVEAILATVEVPVQLGGGIRDMAT